MSEVDRIRDQLRRTFQGEAWHGPAVLEILEGLTAEQAAGRPIPNAHCIWEIVLHITATHNLVLGRLQGSPVIPKPEEDWPGVHENSQEAWETALKAMRLSYAELDQAIGSLDDAQLDKPILEGFSSRYVTLHGLAQHNTCHAGQIALLRNRI